MRRRRIAIAVPTTDGLDAAAWQIAWAYRCPHSCQCCIHASPSTTSGPAAPWRCAAAWGAGLLGGALPPVRAGVLGPPACAVWPRPRPVLRSAPRSLRPGLPRACGRSSGRSGRPAPGALCAPASCRVPVPPAGGPWSLRARCPGRGAPAPLRLGLCALRVGPGCAPRGPPSCASPPGPPRRGPARLRGAGGGHPLRRAGPRFPAAPAGASGAAPPRGARRGSSAPGGRARRRGLAAPWAAVPPRPAAGALGVL